MKELAYTQEAKPLVSVIMPSYNAEKYIKEAIESVIAQTMSQATEAEQFLTGTPVPTIEFMFFIKRTAVSFSQEKKALQCLKANIFSFSTATTG